jgi:type II secretory pathway pseudopilin PulG
MKSSTAIVVLSAVLLSACGKKKTDAPPATSADAAPPAVTSAPATAAAPADSTDAQREQAKKQALMDYATMEDKYMTDSTAQWAATAQASSTFGDDNGKQPSQGSMAINIVGVVDGKTWTNNHQDIGFDWVEATFAKPVNATEVRVVFADGEGAEAVNKIELQGADGKWNTVWSGVSDVKSDRRGSRTWFVRTFEKTPYKANAVKVTIANNVQRGYKVIDAVQLVGN